MKITRLQIAGYRSLHHCVWEPGDLNIIVGPNGGGKSNLLQFLRLITASAKGDLAKFLLSQGGVQLASFDGSNRKYEAISFFLSVDEMEQSSNICNIAYNFRLISISGMAYSVVDERMLVVIQAEDSSKIGRPYLERTQGAFLSDERKERFHIDASDLPTEETVLSLVAAPTLMFPTVKGFRSYVSGWLVLDDFHTDKEASVRQATVTRFDERLDADGQNLVAVLHTLYSGNRQFKQAVDDAMSAAFGEEYEELTFTPAGEQRIQLAVRWANLKRPQTAANLSDGTLRFLFHMTALAQPNPPALIAIDEPETGLHPSMMRIIAEYAQEASRRTQVVLTTHSPALLDAFTETQPTITVCELKDGATVLKNLDGEALKYWLSKYTLGELQQSGQLEAMQPAPEAA